MKSAREEQPESPFISFTDLLTGTVFIFILLVVLLALNQRAAVSREAGAYRQAGFLKDIVTKLHDQGVAVELDSTNGSLSLPDKVLFESGQRELSSKAQFDAVRKVAAVLVDSMKCSVTGLDRKCDGYSVPIAAVLIEGHTDTVKSQDYNWGLSMQRAYSVYRALVRFQPSLASARTLVPPRGGASTRVFGLAGYGETRLKVLTGDDVSQAENRRIEIRFVFQ